MTPEPCAECGSTTYIASTVDTDGVRTCAACLIGLTPMLVRGVPIATTVGELAPRGET